ncbi:MAG: hypothetical protein IJA58_05845 [Lachnospiraceae bacterium]|nr:hypothetical protein [Lachnospiraceae bacterium]
MSFERTKGSITNLSGTKVSVDALLDMLVCVTRDVYENNQVTNVSAMAVDDQSAMLKKLYNLLKLLLTVYEDNQSGVSQFGDRIRNDFARITGSLAENEELIESLVKEIEQNEAYERELRDSHKEVELRRGHLLNVKNECDELTRKIDELNDSKLDEMAETRDELKAELTVREEKAAVLKGECDVTRAQLDQAEEKTDALKAEIASLERNIRALENEERENLEKKAELERTIEQVKTRLAEAKQQLAEFPEKAKAINDEYEDVQAQMTAMLNALNSVKADCLMKNHLFSGGASIATQNHPEMELVSQQLRTWQEMEEWFSNLQERMDALSEVYRAVLAQLVKQAENITGKPESK